MEFTTIKGFKDVLPNEIIKWQILEKQAREIFQSYGFQEVRTPLLEWTELFARGIGQDTDIVSKEMYSLQDSKGRGMTLRPEATASVVRSYIQHRLYDQNPIQKLFSLGPMFRHERPQKGRFRQFHQINAELIGDPGPKSDADIIIMTMHLFDAIGIRGLTLHLNSLGCQECRPRFRATLKDYLLTKHDSLCKDCQRRAETNPLRVFDCKEAGCIKIVSEAPSILEFICDPCRGHFEAVKGYLDRANISFMINPRLVRGLDYYNRTTFEIQTEALGAQNAIAGGGRYDGLVKLLGGPDHPAIGFAIGVERLVTLMDKESATEQEKPDLFIAALGESAEKTCFGWAIELRNLGIWVEMEYGTKGLKAQMKRADRLGAKKVLMVGDDEISRGKALLRDMKTKNQEEIDLKDPILNIRSALK